MGYATFIDRNIENWLILVLVYRLNEKMKRNVDDAL